MNTNNLKVFNNDVIPVYRTSDGKKVTIGRELHAGLKINTDYKDWFPRMCGDDFKEPGDFCSFLSESNGGRRPVNHVLTLRMAKHICMIQRTPQGKAIRDKLIELDDNVEDYVQNRLEEERRRIIPQAIRSEHAAGVASLIRATVGPLVRRRATSMECCEQAKLVMDQCGVEAIPTYTKPNPWESEQLRLEAAAPTMLIGHVDNLSVGNRQSAQN